MKSDPIAYTIPEAVQASGIGRSTLYEKIADGSLPARKLGRRTLILRADLEAMISSLPLATMASRE